VTVTVAGRSTGAAHPTRSTSMVTATVAVLGTPAVEAADPDGAPGVRVRPAPGGPAPARITVEALHPDGRHVPVCRTARATVCTDPAAPAATSLSWTATAELGSWRAAAAPLALWTPPPAPAVAPAGDDRLRVQAPAASGDYTATIVLDGRPPVLLSVPAGEVLDGEVPLDQLGDGTHEARVTTSAHGAQRTGTLRFTLRSGRVGPA
jgi:hypothetical protein